MLVMIDNYDSFTYNLVQYFGELGAEVKTVRNDEIDITGIEALKPEWIVISPGPCTPKEAGVSVDCVKHFRGKLPILGVCLGHQSIGHAHGAKIVRADYLMHGKTDKIHHDDRGLFAGLPNPFTATRYHSLIIRPDSLPEEFEVSAWVDGPHGREIMGVRHREHLLEGWQFHPESFLTECGHELLQRFIEQPGAASL